MFSRRGRTEGQSYFLGNGMCFFHRFADCGFRNKWCGFWSGGRKTLEYFAVRVNGEWLSPQNQKSFEYDFAKAVHTYETAGGKVTETVFVPEESGSVTVIVEAFPGAKIDVKAAVNIRKGDENVTARRYVVSRVTGSVKAENDIGAAVITAGEGGKFEALGTYEEHCPSGEVQNYFLPCRLSFRRSRAAFSIGAERVDVQSADVLLKMKESHYAGLLREKISCDNGMVSKAFESCVFALELLKKDGGYYAGLPWFQQFWGRDTLWSLPAVISLGKHDEARIILRFFAEKSEKGQVPNFSTESGEKAMNAIDATPLWVIALERYVRCSGDMVFLREMER
ncbi:MAG: amylo-alpha-1,6-glucosidase, partial [Candidatus Aenigmatarchaeota archaeon]